MVRIFISLIILLLSRIALAAPCPLNELYKDTANTRHIDWTFLKSDGSQATTSTGKKIAISYYDSAVPEFKWWTGTGWSTTSSESANKLTMSQKSSSGEFYYLLPISTTFWNSISDKIVDIRFIDDSVDGAMATNCQIYIQPVNRFNNTVDTVTIGAISANAITATSIQDGAITPAKEYVISGTVNAVSTTITIYTALAVTNERKYNNMCLYSASNGERSRILSTGNGFFKVRGFGTAPTDGSALKIYEGGCI